MNNLRKKLIRSLSIAQIHSIDAQGEAIIEREADILLKAFSDELERIEKQAIYGHLGVPDCTEFIPLSVIQKIRKELKNG